MAALRWLAKGYGYEVTGADVWAAYSYTMKVAECVDRREEARERIRLLADENRFMTEVLGLELGLTGKATS